MDAVRATKKPAAKKVAKKAAKAKAAPKRPRGQPSKFTDALATEITDRLSKGETLTDICLDAHMPAVRTVSHWKEADAAFLADFTRAREAGHDAIASRMRQTARGKGADVGGDSAGDVQRDRLIIETDLKLLAKWDKRYADRTVLAGDPDAPLLAVPDDQLDARLAALMAKAGT